MVHPPPLPAKKKVPRKRRTLDAHLDRIRDVQKED